MEFIGYRIQEDVLLGLEYLIMIDAVSLVYVNDVFKGFEVDTGCVHYSIPLNLVLDN